MHMSLTNLAARPIVALLAFAGWAIVLVATLAATRLVMVMTKQVRANGFTSGVPHGGDRYWRLNRAHMNSVENLPIFAAIVLGGAALGVSSPLLARMAEIVVVARIAQSFFHVVSGRSLAVNFRFTAFVTQLACFVGMIIETIRLATA